MSHIHWVARQNKLETPKEKDKDNKREVHESDGRGRDPDVIIVMVVPPKPQYQQGIFFFLVGIECKADLGGVCSVMSFSGLLLGKDLRISCDF